MDCLDCSHQALSRISFQLRDVFGNSINLHGNHIYVYSIFSRVQDGSALFWNLVCRMPRKPGSTEVPVEQPEEGLAKVWGNEAKPDAEQMTDIANGVKAPSDTTQKSANEVPATEAPKAKAKRAPKKQPAVAEPEVEVTDSLDEAQAVVSIPAEEEPKEVSKVVCPDWGKQMFAKTLRYNHGPNCVLPKSKSSRHGICLRETSART